MPAATQAAVRFRASSTCDARERIASGFVQDADEIDDGGRPRHQPGERCLVEHIRLDDLDGRQEDQVLGLLATACRHDNFVSRGRQSRDQMAPDKAAAAQHHDARGPHRHSVLAATGSEIVPPRGATTPKREVSDSGAPPNACEYIIEFASTFFT